MNKTKDSTSVILVFSGVFVAVTVIHAGSDSEQSQTYLLCFLVFSCPAIEIVRRRYKAVFHSFQ